MPHASQDSRHLDVTGIAIGRAQAQHVSRRYARQRQTVAVGQTREKSGIEFAIVRFSLSSASARSNCRDLSQLGVCQREHISLQTNLEKERIARLRLEAKIAPRRLSQAETQAIVTALKPYAGQKCSIASLLGDSEARMYAKDFVVALEVAGWDHHGGDGIAQVAYSNDPVGLWIILHPLNESLIETNSAILALIKVMQDLKLLEENGVGGDKLVPAGEVRLRIAKKR